MSVHARFPHLYSCVLRQIKLRFRSCRSQDCSTVSVDGVSCSPSVVSRGRLNTSGEIIGDVVGSVAGFVLLNPFDDWSGRRTLLCSPCREFRRSR